MGLFKKFLPYYISYPMHIYIFIGFGLKKFELGADLFEENQNRLFGFKRVRVQPDTVSLLGPISL